MAAILTIFFRILPNFELELEIPNIMLVCKFEINWSTNTNLRALTTYIGRINRLTDGRPAFPYPPLRFAGARDKKRKQVAVVNTANGTNVFFPPHFSFLYFFSVLFPRISPPLPYFFPPYYF